MRFFEFSGAKPFNAPIDPVKAAERRKKTDDTINKARARTAKAEQNFQAKQDADDEAERLARRSLNTLKG